MDSSKPAVFLSHASEDEWLVKELKSWLDERFGRSVAFFVSQDVRGGEEWMEAIKTQLRNARMVLLLVTRNFLDKRWCFFETGAAYFSGLAVAPLCYTDVSLRELPSPIQFLQGYELKKRDHIASLLRQVGDECGVEPAAVPANYVDFQHRIGIFEDPPSVDEDLENGFETYCVGLLGSDDLADRIAGVRMLSGLRTKSAFAKIVDSVSTTDRHVRKVALDALHYAAVAFHVDVVKELLDEANAMPHECVQDSARLIQEIGNPGDAERIENFLALCPDERIKGYLGAAKRHLEERRAMEPAR